MEPGLSSSRPSPNPDGYIRVRKQQLGLGSDVNGELAIFAVDFSLQSSRKRAEPLAPPCGGECAFRGRPQAGCLADQAERARIHAALALVNLALRP